MSPHKSLPCAPVSPRRERQPQAGCFVVREACNCGAVPLHVENVHNVKGIARDCKQGRGRVPRAVLAPVTRVVKCDRRVVQYFFVLPRCPRSSRTSPHEELQSLVGRAYSVQGTRVLTELLHLSPAPLRERHNPDAVGIHHRSQPIGIRGDLGTIHGIAERANGISPTPVPGAGSPGT